MNTASPVDPYVRIAGETVSGIHGGNTGSILEGNR
jgi:hypothetical protein